MKFLTQTTAPPRAAIPPTAGRGARALVAACLAATLALGVLAGCDAPAPASEPAADVPPALTVTTVPAGSRSIERNVIATGSVVAWQELSIGTEISGLRVVDVPVEEGDWVKRGQLLAQIDTNTIGAQVRHAEAAVQEAESNLKFAQTENERAKDLVAKGNISPQTAQDRDTKAFAAGARLEMAKAQRDEMKARLAATRIVAPADGYVSKRSVLIGDVVGAGREVFRMVRDGRLELDAQVPESDLALVRPEQKVRIVREGTAPIMATIRAIAPTVDPKTRLGVVHVAIPPNSPLKPGMFARAEILAAQAIAVAVPEAALVWRDGQASVFVLSDKSHVALRQIETGGRQDGWVEVLRGLTAGERVVNTGAGFLHDGDTVLVQANPGAKAAATPAPARN